MDDADHVALVAETFADDRETAIGETLYPRAPMQGRLSGAAFLLAAHAASALDKAMRDGGL
jgi:hypothetical protein